MAQNCKGCYHWRRIGSGLAMFACHYCIDEDRLRDCPASECTNHITEKEYEKMKKQRIPAEVRERVIQAAREGVPYKAVAEQLGLSPQSVSRLAVGAGIIRHPERIKKSPEAPTAMENASEDITSSGISAATSIPDVPENVKQEAPIETLSRAFNALSEHIAQSFGSSAQENSTPLHERYSSLDIVDEAVLEKIQRNKDEIAEHRERIDYLEFEIERLNEFHCNFTEGRSV